MNGTFLCSREAARAITEGGAILNLSSIAASGCRPWFPQGRRQSPKIALIAALRKRVTILNVMLKTGQPWDPKAA